MTATPRDLSPLFRPRSLAIVGASPTSFFGQVTLANARWFGYAGPIYPVNPKYERISHPATGEIPCYPSVEEIPGEVDCVLFLVRPRLVPAALRQAVAKGARAAVIPVGGYTESGQEALEMAEEVRAIADESGLVVAGPNCMGTISPLDGTAIYIGTITESVVPGHVSVVNQSGSATEALVNIGRRIGYRYIVSSGNELVVDNVDYIRYFIDDPETWAILAFVEGLKRPREFLETVRLAAERDKPIVVLKVGRSVIAQAGVQAHTGNLAGSAAVYDAALRQAGAIVVHDLDELVEAGELLGTGRRPRGGRVAFVGMSGGEASLIADLAEPIGVTLPPTPPGVKAAIQERFPNFAHVANPMDAWGVAAPDEVYPFVLRQLAHSGAFDFVGLAYDNQAEAGESERSLGLAALDWLVEVTAGTEVVPLAMLVVSDAPDGASRLRAKELRVPLLRGARPSLAAIRGLVGYQAFVERHRALSAAESLERRPLVDPDAARAAFAALRAAADPATGVVGEHRSKAFLAATGVALPGERLAGTADEAVAAADAIGYPVVLKVQGRGFAHKTEAGGVRLGLRHADDVRAAFVEAIASVRAHAPEVEVSGVLVEEQIDLDGATELLVGLTTDPQFGPVVALGLGGIFVELLRDAVLRLPPFDAADGERMTRELRGTALLDGPRGWPAVDRAAVGRALAALGDLALACGPGLRQVDLNPLVWVPGRGLVALDALCIVSQGEPRAQS